MPEPYATPTGRSPFRTPAGFDFGLIIAIKSLRHEKRKNPLDSLTMSGFMMIPIYITRDAYIQRLIDQGYGQAYADKMMSVLPNWTFLPVLLLGAIGGYLGATIGIKMLQKHFKKLGMA